MVHSWEGALQEARDAGDRAFESGRNDDFESTIPVIEAALAAAPSDDHEARAELCFLLARSSSWVDVDRSAEISADAETEARLAGDPRSRMFASWAAHAFGVRGVDRLAERSRYIAETIDLAREVGDDRALFSALYTATVDAMTNLDRGAFDSALEDLRQLADVTRDEGRRAVCDVVDHGIAVAEMRWDEAATALVVAGGRDASDRIAERVPAITGLYVRDLGLLAGNAELRTVVEGADVAADPLPSQELVRAVLLSETGARDVARDIAVRYAGDSWAPLVDSPDPEPGLWAAAELAYVLGERDWAESLQCHLRALSGHAVTSYWLGGWMFGLATHSSGMMALLLDEPEEAVRSFGGAEREARSFAAPLHEHRARAMLAVALERLGETAGTGAIRRVVDDAACRTEVFTGASEPVSPSTRAPWERVSRATGLMAAAESVEDLVVRSVTTLVALVPSSAVRAAILDPDGRVGFTAGYPASAAFEVGDHWAAPVVPAGKATTERRGAAAVLVVGLDDRRVAIEVDATGAGGDAGAAVPMDSVLDVIGVHVRANAAGLSARRVPSDDAHSSVTSLAERFELTDREAEVTEHLRRGLSTKRLAQVLGISERTVQKHLQNIYRKLGVTCRTAALVRLQGSFE